MNSDKFRADGEVQNWIFGHSGALCDIHPENKIIAKSLHQICLNENIGMKSDGG